MFSDDRGDLLRYAGWLLLIGALSLVVVAPGRPTLAAFNASTSVPTNLFTSLVVQSAVLTAATTQAAGKVHLVWTASPTASTETVTYSILRRPAGPGSFSVIGTAAGLSYDDTPATDGSYDYEVRTAVSTFSADSALRTGLSDRAAPTTAVTCNSAACVAWYTASVSVTLTATDAGSGVSTITRTLDGTPTTTASPVTFTVSGDLAHALSYYGTDVAGNVASTQSLTIGIDATVPTAPTGLSATTGATTGTVNLGWAAGTDATSGVAGYTIRYVQKTTCPTSATPTNFTSSTTAGAVTSTIVGSLVTTKKYCFYLTTTDTAGNASTASAIVSATAK